MPEHIIPTRTVEATATALIHNHLLLCDWGDPIDLLHKWLCPPTTAIIDTAIEESLQTGLLCLRSSTLFGPIGPADISASAKVLTETPSSSSYVNLFDQYATTFLAQFLVQGLGGVREARMYLRRSIQVQAVQVVVACNW